MGQLVAAGLLVGKQKSAKGSQETSDQKTQMTALSPEQT